MSFHSTPFKYFEDINYTSNSYHSTQNETIPFILMSFNVCVGNVLACGVARPFHSVRAAFGSDDGAFLLV